MLLHPPSGVEFLRLMRAGEVILSPCTLELAQAQERPFGASGQLRVKWREKSVVCEFEYRPSGSPNFFEMFFASTFNRSSEGDAAALITLMVRPFLAEKELRRLEEHGLSGFDLCGNGVVITPEFQLWRTGNPNRFKRSQTLRQPFTGDSSVFARCFLLRGEFSTLSELQRFARVRTFGPDEQDKAALRHPGLALPTASKVVRALTEELVVERQGQGLRLRDAKRLLKLLREEGNSRRPKPPSLTGKTALSPEEIWSRLRAARETSGLRAVATGLYSSGHYGALSGVDTPSLYVSDLHTLAEVLGVRATRAFANIELREDRKNAVYFDARPDRDNSDVLWASPIQTWLELTRSGPREQEAASQLERALLEGRADSL